jgi:hypothetical protein
VNGGVLFCYVLSMTCFDVVKQESTSPKLHRHVISVYEWYAYYAELN